MTYSIPECNMEALEKKLTRISNKCRKYGCNFHCERIGEHFEEKTVVDYDTVLYEINGQRVYRHWTEVVKYIDIDVEGTAIVNGWQFAASLEYTDKGNIIHSVGLEIPERYYSCDPWCEHCKTKRDRRNSYIVYNEQSGEFKQVGKSCLLDFTGGLSAEYAANFESFFKELDEATEFIGGGYSGPSYFKLHDFMVCAAETIRVFGYAKRNTEGVTATAIRAEDLFRVENHMRLPAICAEEMRRNYDFAVEHGFNTKNPQSIELADKVIDWCVNNDRNDNYLHNLKIVCSLSHVTADKIGLLVSAFPAFNRELERQAEQREREEREKQAAANSAWMGEVGDKVSFKIADFRCITSWETQWGLTHVWKFVDENGRQATWKTSNWVDEKDIGKTVKATIKEQKEWNGIKQTELTRCRIQ